MSWKTSTVPGTSSSTTSTQCSLTTSGSAWAAGRDTLLRDRDTGEERLRRLKARLGVRVRALEAAGEGEEVHRCQAADRTRFRFSEEAAAAAGCR